MTERPISADASPAAWPAIAGRKAAEVDRLRAAIETHRAAWIRANGDANENNARPDDLELWAALDG